MGNTRWLTNSEQQLWRSFLETNQRVFRQVDEQLQADFDLTNSEFGVLALLSEADEQQLRAKDLGDQLGWERSRISHQITRMQKRGLVEKRKCPVDSRGIFVHITEQGMKRLKEAAPSHVETVRESLLAPLSNDEQQQLFHLLEKIRLPLSDPAPSE